MKEIRRCFLFVVVEQVDGFASRMFSSAVQENKLLLY